MIRDEFAAMRLEPSEIRVGGIHDIAQRLFGVRDTFVGIKAHKIPLRVLVDQICESFIGHYTPPCFGMGFRPTGTREILGPADGFAAKRHTGEYLLARARLRSVMKSLVRLELW